MEITEVLESFGNDGVNHQEVSAVFYTHDCHEVSLVEIGDYNFTIEELERIISILKFVDKMNKD